MLSGGASSSSSGPTPVAVVRVAVVDVRVVRVPVMERVVGVLVRVRLALGVARGVHVAMVLVVGVVVRVRELLRTGPRMPPNRTAPASQRASCRVRAAWDRVPRTSRNRNRPTPEPP
jgi:hypothetical protein